MSLIDIETLEPQELDGHWGMVARELVREGRDELIALRCDMEPNGGANEHVHEKQNHVFLLLEGHLEVTLNGEEKVRVEAGQALEIPAGRRHATRNPGPDPACYIALTYQISSAESVRP